MLLCIKAISSNSFFIVVIVLSYYCYFKYTQKENVDNLLRLCFQGIGKHLIILNE